MEKPGESRNACIWLIEDNPADVLLVREALNEHGVKADLLTVRDGEQAFEMVEELEGNAVECPDLIILDLNLPRKSGREVLQLIRAGPKCRAIPVLILTSSNALTDRRDAAQLGVTLYIRKPSNLEEFMRIGEIIRGVLFDVSNPA
jgi:CheY-like chemotaxis protein